MDCEHLGGSGMSNCPMACCQESSHVLAAPAIFVMREPATICLLSLAMTAPSNFVGTELVQSFAPPSPPPRTPLQSL